MKNCLFCGLLIEDNAKKCHHCLSFQKVGEKRGEKCDIANLIVHYIGIITVVFSILLGIFGFLGFKSFSDLQNRSEKVLERTNSKIDVFEKELVKLTADFSANNKALNGILISQLHDRYHNILDRIVIDNVETIGPLISELKHINKEAQKARTSGSDRVNHLIFNR